MSGPSGARPHNPLNGQKFVSGDVSLKPGTVPAAGTPRFILNPTKKKKKKKKKKQIYTLATVLPTQASRYLGAALKAPGPRIVGVGVAAG